MTRPARDGRDGPFSAWLRCQPGLDSVNNGLYISDIDFSFHKYKQRDDNGSEHRDVKLMLDLEVKSFGAIPSAEQKETLFFKHQTLRTKDTQRKLISTYLDRKVSVWHFGQYVLRMDNVCPDTSERMWWHVFDADGMANPTRITKDILIDLLSFQRDPDEPSMRLSTRRHHPEPYTMWVKQEGTLFDIERPRTVRS